jgi:atypical dual specificity phosphatase
MTSFFRKERSPHPPPTLRWVIPQQIAIGSLPTAELYPVMMTAGIKAILTLCTEAEGQPTPEMQSSFQCIRHALPDSYAAETLQPHSLAKAVAIVHQFVTARQPLYVHCLAGIERSPTVCAAYLCLHQGLQPWEALHCLRQVNPKTHLIDSQIQAIQQLVREKSV